MTSKIFEAFACRDMGDKTSVLHTDYGLDCNSSSYTMLYIANVVLIFLFPLGMPSMLFFLMNRVKDLILTEDRETMNEFGFVVQDYKLTHWYWEVVE